MIGKCGNIDISSFWISLLRFLVQKPKPITKMIWPRGAQNRAAPGLSPPSYSQISSGSAGLFVILEGHSEDSEIPAPCVDSPRAGDAALLRVVETIYTSVHCRISGFLARGKICLSKSIMYSGCTQWVCLETYLCQNIMYSLYIPRKG